MAHLWTRGPCPPEYLESYLRRKVYHCTPQELRQIPLEDILIDLTCMRIEADVQAANRRMQNTTHGRKR